MNSRNNTPLSSMVHDYRVATGLTEEEFALKLRAIRPISIERLERGEYDHLRGEIARLLVHGLNRAGMLA